MTERYNVEVEDVLGENYKITNIECSDYNPSIDGNITVTITNSVKWGTSTTWATSQRNLYSIKVEAL